jgi:hypothetical protein
MEVTVNRCRALNTLGALSALALVTGCAPTLTNSGTQSHYQILTAGHTGCVPEENQLSNLDVRPNGDGTWNAECKNKTYLCSVTGQQQELVACAPVAK